MIQLQRDDDKRPKYLRLADWVRQQVKDGQLQPEQQLLSYAEIEAQLGFSQKTVERAYAILEQEDLIYREPGRGVFVKPTPGTRKQTGLIGYVDQVFQFSKSTLYYTSLLQGAQRAAEAADKQLVVISSVEKFKQWDLLEGVLLCASGHQDSFRAETVRAQVPAGLPMINSLIPDRVVPSVVADDADGIRQLMEYLLELGHRRIAYLSHIGVEPVKHHPLVQLRYEAYRSTLQQHGLEFEPEFLYSNPVAWAGDHYEFGYANMSKWLKEDWSSLDCTAIMAHNDFTAMGIIDALREAGLSVPGDVSVVGFDGSEVVRTASYDLTTARVPLSKIGTKMVQELLAHIQNPQARSKDIVLPVELVVGKTTAVLNDRYATGGPVGSAMVY